MVFYHNCKSIKFVCVQNTPMKGEHLFFTTLPNFSNSLTYTTSKELSRYDLRNDTSRRLQVKYWSIPISPIANSLLSHLSPNQCQPTH